jgi:archaeal flagellar protein FlaJ
MITIPFSIVPPKVLERLGRRFLNWGAFFEKMFPFLQQELSKANFKISAKKYLAMCFVATVFIFIIFGGMLTLFFANSGKILGGVVIAFFVALFIFFMQANYPKVLANRRIKKLDSDLLGALRAIMIQLNSGVPLFETLVITSKQQFGELSKEFKIVVDEISAGTPQIDALERMALRNPSPYFRRALWQIINAMKEGSVINSVIENIIINLNKEQIVQIEKYGSQLSPIAMFYMMGAVIMPALGIIFLVVIVSFVPLDEVIVKGLFWGLLGVVLFIQFVFTGIIKTKRPSLLEE